MKFIRLDRPLEVVNIRATDKTHFVAKSPAPLRFFWVASHPFEAFKVGDVLAVLVEEGKLSKEEVELASDAGKLHTIVTISHVAFVDDGEIVNLSDFLTTVRHVGSGKGGFTGTPRKPVYGAGERMQAKTITLPPSYWAIINGLPGNNLSEKVRGMVENAGTINLGQLPT